MLLTLLEIFNYTSIKVNTAGRCPRDRRFTLLLGVEKELFALLLLDSLDTLCFLLIFYWIYFRKAFEEEKISSILQWYSHFYSIIHSNILVHYQNILIFLLSLSSVLFLYRKLPILEDMLQSLFSVMALLLWSPWWCLIKTPWFLHR